MALTREFLETTGNRLQASARFRKAVLAEALNAYWEGDSATGKAMLRDFVNATIGFERLSAETGRPAKSLHRMLGPSGNPSTENFFLILRVLQTHESLRLIVKAA